MPQYSVFQLPSILKFIITMIVGVTAVAFTIALFLWDTKNKKKKQRPCVNICVTGGPCGGKSLGVKFLHQKLKEHSVVGFIVPEAATIIGSAGFSLNLAQCSSSQIQSFQLYLLRLQINLESFMNSFGERILSKTNKKSVILCDRGLLDGKAYAHEENWLNMLKKINVNQKQILRRYDAIIHMVTAADGAPQSYAYNKVRKESIEEVFIPKIKAIQLDRQLQKDYEKHRFHYIVGNDVVVNSFEDKKKVLWVFAHQAILHSITGYSFTDYYNKEKEQNNMINIY